MKSLLAGTLLGRRLHIAFPLAFYRYTGYDGRVLLSP